MASCSQCNAELADGAKFCPNCGATVSTEVACPSCTAVNAAGAKFCTNCGQVLGAGNEPPAAERKDSTDPTAVIQDSGQAETLGQYEQILKEFLADKYRKYKAYLMEKDGE